MQPLVPDLPAPDAGVSISAVAVHAGVSVATVSRVMNQQSGVRPATRAKVLATVDALGYRMNHLARSLRTAESRMLLTMVPDVGNPFYAQIVRGIDTVARKHGYFVLLCDAGA
jgi:LacI family repressor for deo operon, udp, cdd, tsx, nupC, and nupG